MVSPTEKLSTKRGRKPKIDFSEYTAASNPVVESVPSTPLKSPSATSESISFNTPSMHPAMDEVIFTTPKTNSSKKKVKVTIEPGSLQPPSGWQDIYSLVEELRADHTAPVDSDGCNALAQRDRGPQVFRFQVLIALMLSSQTKDAVVGDTMRNLQRFGLDVPTIHATSEDTLNERICKVGFHNNKSKFIKQTVAILVRDYNGDIPGTADELMNLPGVGPKMAYIVEQVAWGRCTGIGVDTHMHRLFQDLGWVKETASPEKTREEIQGWLPREKWDQVNCLWVGFGQETQQQKEKVIRKALGCSKPAEALKLLKKIGINLDKEAKKYGLDDEVKKLMKPSK